ncbi:MAG: hypothetical protein RBQ97_10870, partial [Acholeplasma sp.]|nr:hypothetical protein [Acholeplasma sp.]
DDLINEMSKHTLDELLDTDGKYASMKLQKSRKVKEYGKWVEKTYETPLISPAWTSPVSRDNMIERKLRNHATRKYPKTFKSPYIQEKYEQTFDEHYERKNVIEANAEEHVEKAQLEFDEKSGKKDLFEKNKEVNANDNTSVKDTEPQEPINKGGKELVIEGESYENNEDVNVNDNDDDKDTFEPTESQGQEEQIREPKTVESQGKRKPLFDLPKK